VHPRFPRFEPIAERDGVFLEFRGRRWRASSVNNTRRNCIRPDTVSQEFHSQCAVKRRNGGLVNHRQRNRRASQRLIYQNRRDAHDMAGLLFAHLRDHSLRDEKVTRNVRANHRYIEKQNLEEMIARADKVRFEIKDDKIRALYGHSSSYSSFIPFTKIQKIASKPPDILYHGTSPYTAKNIMSEGLRPMNRQYVHLSTDKNTALQVGKRNTILKKEAFVNNLI
jgi:RNA:NAD 2'-phosphotransferase (TPT1/KptA family)